MLLNGIPASLLRLLAWLGPPLRLTRNVSLLLEHLLQKFVDGSVFLRISCARLLVSR